MRFTPAVATAVLFLVFSGAARAQAPVYHPGDTIKVSVTFEGPDAAKITNVNMYVNTEKAAPNQEGFEKDFRTNQFNRINPVTFEITYTVPQNLASGEYHLEDITVVLDQSAPIRFSYRSPTDFKPKTFKIENPKTVTRPTIKDEKEL